jgi:hypothetical protein
MSGFSDDPHGSLAEVFAFRFLLFRNLFPVFWCVLVSHAKQLAIIRSTWLEPVDFKLLHYLRADSMDDSARVG